MKKILVISVMTLLSSSLVQANDAGTLRAALLAICPITSVTIGDPSDRTTWNIVYDPSCTAAQQAQGAALVAAYDMSYVAPPPLTPAQFTALFTQAELLAMASSSDPQVKLFMVLLPILGVSGIQLNNPQIVADVNYLTTTNPPILTSAEAARILAGTAPQ